MEARFPPSRLSQLPHRPLRPIPLPASTVSLPSGRRLLHLVPTMIITATGVLLAALLAYTSLHLYSTGPNLPHGSAGCGCEMSWMRPSYYSVPLTPDDTRLSDKYSLYLYRENGLNGPLSHHFGKSASPSYPILFIPGNGGSFKQARSLASYAAKTHRSTTIAFPRFDFFTIDFNEDFSAFHGHTLIEQSSFIIASLRHISTLYSSSRKPLNNIEFTIVAHSMGGISARLALHELQNGVKGPSINTLITLSTPHLLPPAPFDPALSDVYSTIQSPINSDLVTISIAGGQKDTTVSGDGVRLPSSVFRSNRSLSVFTSAVANLWSDVDHLAMMWCNQLRPAILNGLATSASTSPTPEKRFEILRSSLLGMSVPFFQEPSLSSTEPILATSLRHHLLSLPYHADEEEREHGTVFLPIDKYGSKSLFALSSTSNFPIWLCTDFNVLTCRIATNYTEILQPLPTSSPHQVLSLYKIPFSNLETYSFVAFQSYQSSNSLWTLAGFQYDSPVVIDGVSLASLFIRALSIEIPMRGFRGQAHLPNMDSSLITYKISRYARPNECASPRFSTTLRTSLLSPEYEAKHYSPFDKGYLHMHGSAPFIGSVGSDRYNRTGVLFEVFADQTSCPGSPTAVTVEIKVDLFKTLGNIFIRYRLAFASWPLSILLIVICHQIGVYETSGTFLALDLAFSSFLKNNSLYLIGGISVGMILQSIALKHYSSSGIVNRASLLPNFLEFLSKAQWQAAFLGTEHLIFVPIGWMLIACSFAAVIISYYLLLGAASIVSRMIGLFFRSYVDILENRKSSTSQDLIIRFATLLVLCGCVILVSPYQFAFMVLSLINFIHVSRVLMAAKASTPYSSAEAWNRFNFHVSMQMIFIWLIPLNGAILIVWIRNLLAGYFAPFSSDHNILAVGGFLLWADVVLAAGTQSPLSLFPLSKHWVTRKSKYLFVLIGAYGLTFGMRYTYNMHRWCNWLFYIMAGFEYLYSQGSALGRSERIE